jgi:hypothetical protein
MRLSVRHVALPTVDDDDVQRFVDDLANNPRTRALDAETAYMLALGKQQIDQMTPAYAAEFARKVRQRVQWTKPSN